MASRARRESGSTTTRSRSASTRVTTDQEEIRRWAEERGARPARVRRTGGGDDPGILRLDFPGYSGADSLEHISWDEFFEKFEENNLALLFQEETARGQRSNFNKLIDRGSAQGGATRARSQRTRARSRSAGGTVRSRRRSSQAGGRARSTRSKRGSRGASRPAASSRNQRSRRRTSVKVAKSATRSRRSSAGRRTQRRAA
jgi:hypothetical protein